MIREETVDGVRVLHLEAGQNRFDAAFVDALAAALDAAASDGGPLVLVGTDKHFCTGLDLDWLREATPEDSRAMFRRLHEVLARLLGFPGATVAAINGHAFGAGAILAAAADLRIQRAERGYLCFPEVDLGLAMSDEFDAVLRAKLPTNAVLRALLTGHRYTAAEAEAAGLVDEAVPGEQLLPRALELAGSFVDKDPRTVAAIKAQQHRAPIAALAGG